MQSETAALHVEIKTAACSQTSERFTASPPPLSPAVELQLVRCQIHNPIRVRANSQMYFAFCKGLDYWDLKRGISWPLRNIPRLIITRSVHFIFGTTRREFVSSSETCCSQWNSVTESELQNAPQTVAYSMEPCGILIQASGQGRRVDHVAGPFTGFLKLLRHRSGPEVKRRVHPQN